MISRPKKVSPSTINAAAAKRVIVWQLAEAMKTTGITKTEMDARMQTSRAAVNRVFEGTTPR